MKFRAAFPWLVLSLLAVPRPMKASDPSLAVLPEVQVVSTVQTDTSLGTSTYSLSRGQIQTIAQGPDSTFNQVLFRTPGVSQDSAGEVHFREEDPYYQYYINGVLLPRAINGFAQEINTRFVDSITLKVGALPAQYAWGNYGIVAIQSNTGADLAGNELSFYGGSHDTASVSAATGGSRGKADYYFTTGLVSNDLGIENPTPEAEAIHDHTRQFHGLGYVSYQLSDTSRASVIFSASHADFQIPNNPGQVSQIEFARRAANFPVAQSSALDETQTEQSYYAIATYRQTRGDFSFQVAQVNRYSAVLFRPDVNGDLYFNGVASRVFRDILTDGLQADFTYQAGAAHTVRGGLLFDTAGARDHNRVSVFAAEDDDVDPVTGKLIAKNAPFTITDHHFKRGYDSTLYLQDEWKARERLTVNFGGRFDQVDAYVHESQISPRVSAVYALNADTKLHAGYARYFIPPPLENVSPTSVAKFDDTTNAADQDVDDPVKCERSDYLDAGFTHNFSPQWQLGVDAYYKRAKNQIDDGQFGAANINSPYNYASATIYGAELAVSYTREAFAAYANFAAADGWARHIVSSQFEFDQDELDYIANHNIPLDQTQLYTASAGASYAWKHTTLHGDVIYGNGMRNGDNNRDKLPAYYPVNLGISHRIPFGRSRIATLRLDVVNIFDQGYVLNDGTGIGVGAPKFGARRGFFGGISCAF